MLEHAEDRDHYWMQQAYQLAQQAGQEKEVPVGAVLVHQDEVIAKAYNQPIRLCDPTAHAEILALRKGAEKLGNYRLIATTLYVTLEPCMMCAAALVHARIDRLVYGASDPKAGGVISKDQILDKPFVNHQVTHRGGVLAEASGQLLKAFFKARRLGEC